MAISIELPSELCISEVESLKLQLLEALSQAEDVDLDGAGVERIDTAGIQLLVALSKLVETQGGCMQWRQASSTLVEAASELGAGDQLNLPSR
ncbi:STAS domain-containing protein [Marinobacterium litorale]|uniref:STAS domain-containing protein n=1 Tax=Marinobacterium litorale TaxID=404770 RepID=UPI0004241CB2|nr:STAS domain-containing protein [Marinobacterium litorale]